MNKRIILLFLTLCVLFITIGCKKTDDKPNESIFCEGCHGLIIEKTKTTYNTGETVSLSDMKVFATNEDNSIKIELSKDKYTVSFYQDSTKIDNISDLKAGRYQIWVEADINGGEHAKTFEFVYVKAKVKSIKLDETTGVFTQKAGPDEMSSTWRFVVTYLNGTTRTVSLETLGMTLDEEHFATGSKGTFSIVASYAEENDPTNKRDVTVQFTITE